MFLQIYNQNLYTTEEMMVVVMVVVVIALLSSLCLPKWGK